MEPRKVTEQEAEQWTELAREHGHLNEEGAFALGRFVVEGEIDGVMHIRVITPIPAGLYTEDLQKKVPPILFDRTPEGSIIFPGRWWQNMFEKLSEAEDAPEEIRATARIASRNVFVSDGYLSPDTDTILIEAPNEEGDMLPTEALTPGGLIKMRVTPLGGG